MVKIQHVVFDIGKVLINYDPEIPFRRLIPDDAERADFFAHICTHEWNLEQDRGRTWGEAEALLTARHPQHEANIRGFRTYWHEMVYSEIAGSVAIMRGLMASGMDVTMLTNFAGDTFAQASDMYPFLKEPRGVTVSGLVGLIKPDEAIYRLHTQTFALEPGATLFIDDNPDNVKAAQDFGWQAVLFTGVEGLARDLDTRGILL
jgi:2-haloacid dehalogenase